MGWKVPTTNTMSNPHGGASSGSGGPDGQPIPPTNRGGTMGGLRPSTAATAAAAAQAQLQAQLQQAQDVPVPGGSLPRDPWQTQGTDPWAAANALPPGNPPDLAQQQAQAWSGYAPPAKAALPTPAQLGITPSAGGPQRIPFTGSFVTNVGSPAVLPAPAMFPQMPLGGGPPPANPLPPGQAYPAMSATPNVLPPVGFGDIRGTAGPEQIVRAMGGVGNAARREPCPSWTDPHDSHLPGQGKTSYEDWRRLFMHWYNGERFLQSPIQMLTRTMVNAMQGKVKKILLNLGDDKLYSAGIPGDPNYPRWFGTPSTCSGQTLSQDRQRIGQGSDEEVQQLFQEEEPVHA